MLCRYGSSDIMSLVRLAKDSVLKLPIFENLPLLKNSRLHNSFTVQHKQLNKIVLAEK